MTEEMFKKTILSSMNPFILIICLIAFAVVAFLCARRYRDTSDFSKSLKLYIPLALAEVVLSVFIGIPLIMAIGCGMAGFVVLLKVSNYYFYH